jgi:hypothetical protein
MLSLEPGTTLANNTALKLSFRGAFHSLKGTFPYDLAIESTVWPSNLSASHPALQHTADLLTGD